MKPTKEQIAAHLRTLKIRALDVTPWLEEGHRPVSGGAGLVRCIDCGKSGYGDERPSRCEPA